jgi:hypothetical protein
MITSQKELRAAFWGAFPDLANRARRNGVKSKGQNAQDCDTRCAFVDWLDYMHRGGFVSGELADRATL